MTSRRKGHVEKMTSRKKVWNLLSSTTSAPKDLYTRQQAPILLKTTGITTYKDNTNEKWQNQILRISLKISDMKAKRNTQQKFETFKTY